MDGSLGSVTIQPEQMFILSPFMILFLVPLMDKVIFPLLNKKGLFLTPLKKIGFGGFLAALAFVIAGVVELNIEVCIYMFINISNICVMMAVFDLTKVYFL